MIYSSGVQSMDVSLLYTATTENGSSQFCVCLPSPVICSTSSAAQPATDNLVQVSVVVRASLKASQGFRLADSKTGVVVI